MSHSTETALSTEESSVLSFGNISERLATKVAKWNQPIWQLYLQLAESRNKPSIDCDTCHNR